MTEDQRKIASKCFFAKHLQNKWKKRLKEAGFKETERAARQFRFYRCTQDKVAFVVNLNSQGGHITVIYGFTSIVDQDYLEKYGEDNDDIKLRFCSVVKSKQDESAVAREIQNVYDTYLHRSKDEILQLKKDRQKQFLQKITDKLKPLGFKKKGAIWIRLLDSELMVQFEAQKSQWSDVYYFNIRISPKDSQFSPCYYMRLNTNGKGIYNWQLMTDEDLNCVLDEAIQSVLTPIINTPIAELGSKKEMWQGCFCARNKCNTCWVQKNLWEADKAK